MRISVIINPYARNFAEGIDERISAILKEFKLEIRQTNSEEEVRKVIDELYEKTDIWCLTGGDGTVNLFLTTVWNITQKNELPYVLHIKGGTMNLITQNIPLKGTIDDILFRFRELISEIKGIEKIPRDNIRKVKLIRIDYSYWDKPKLCFSFTLGVPFKITKKFYSVDNKNPRTALQTLYSSIARFVVGRDTERIIEKIKAKLIIEGKLWEYDEHYVIVGSTFKKLVLFFKPFRVDDRWKDGFYFFVYSGDAWTALKNFRAYSTGKKTPPHSFNDVVELVEIITSEGFNYDGELVEPQKEYTLTLSAGPIANLIRV